MSILNYVEAPAADDIKKGSLIGSVTGIALSSTKAFSPSTKYVNEQTAGVASIVHAAVGYFVGEAHGHKREREGKQSFVPLMRG